MRMILAITIAFISAPAMAYELSPGEIAWGTAAHACLQRIAPECEIRTDHPKFPGQLKMRCPANTPHFVKAQKTCDEEADAKTQPNPAGKWQPPAGNQKGYDAS